MHSIWSTCDELTRYGRIFRASVDAASFGPEAPKTDVWFRDLVAIKTQHQLGIHLNLVGRLEEAENGRGAEDEEGRAYREMLGRLKEMSRVRLLDVSREYAGMLVCFPLPAFSFSSRWS
jgi:hypothetical protein